jgi:hypothetical protein
MDLNLPFLNVEELEREEKELEEIMSVDLEEFRVKHGVITQMKYDTEAPGDLRQYGNTCT